MTWGIVIFFLTLCVDLTTDYLRYMGRKSINHLRGAWLRCIGLIPAGILLSIKDQHWYWGLAVSAAAAVFFVYWALFDSIYGKLIGQGWGFIGTTGRLDQLQRESPWLKTCKYIAAVMWLIIYIIIRHGR